MTIIEINKKLEQIKSNPSRENILDFSFGLLQWMNIEPNTANKPQLLSPQTQKLKDFLATAPQTVQPQLYRISADNQNIRVRFAVLKKLKKEYISQLVDNDPGLGSYQSFSKGLIQQDSAKGGTGSTTFIPAQPYFIHFVTTPDYDKLVLIFNQGEQKRIVSFRNRLTNTQYNKIIQQWQSIGTKPKPEIADLLWKSLDIKEVNKEFYKQIKERFDALLGILSEPGFAGLKDSKIENQIKQFTVRFLGRYIFCWFLKEKNQNGVSMIPYELISSDEIKKFKAAGKSFYHERLLKLFFGTLNTLVSNRDWLLAEPVDSKNKFEKIPYLNGGLFDDNNDEDRYFNSLQFDINDWLIKFVEILESYDFTVDESSSQYQQVAVDPEMLGRIFENLLASQNEETSTLANQRKAFGAFYTPREIVDYMVNESIKAFLQTQLSEPGFTGFKDEQDLEKKTAPLFAANADASHLKKEEKNYILQKLEQIKILDPACGSGAFPMGILHKLVELHEALGTVKSSYELKKDILSQNIYGVDIMPMAIEIARLRAWLSLVLEEDYKPNDPKHNFGVKPLPNLDFKFVCANSLIDLGLDAFIQESKNSLLAGFNEKLITQLKALEDLRKHFFTPALASIEKEKLKNEYLQKRNEVVAAIEKESEPVLTAIAKKIKHWNPFDDSHPSTFFSPTWMFGIDKGFDVVIGNPPYITYHGRRRILASNNLIDYFKANYQSAKNSGKDGKFNSAMFFIEKATHIGTSHCISCLITDISFYENFYSELKKHLVKNTLIQEIINGFTAFENVGSGQLILIYRNVPTSDKKKIQSNLVKVRQFGIDSETQLINQELWNNPMNKYQFFLPNESSDVIYSKIETKSKKLEDFFPKKLIRTGESVGIKEEGFVIDELPKKDSVQIYEYLEGSKSVPSKYSTPKPTRYFRYDVELLNSRNLSYRDDAEENERNNPKVLGIGDKLAFDNPKILIRQSCDHICATYTDKPFVYNRSYYSISNHNSSARSRVNLLYILGLLNSNLINYYSVGKRIIRMEIGKQPQIRLEDVKRIPVILGSENLQKQIEKLVDEILKKKKSNHDTTSLEKEIDVMVYHLYELSYEEVKIIEPNFALNQQQYENYTAK